ncbi:phytanoyl-CoA dioxygenase family protein [Paenibacillus solisilvae]|uniref:Phytanoyl-CoA dioxygenase family protein n=1 Tax=Paenibacillus solisilvae TaxID=2486751 RepID=A0ABW0W4V5_9BACL
MTLKQEQDNDKQPVSGAFEDSTSLLSKPDQLRARAEKDGLLFFRGLLDREHVLALRLDILEILDRYGVMSSRHPLQAGIADLTAVNRYSESELQWNGVGVTEAMYLDIQKLESFHALAHSPALLSMYESLFGGTAPFVHPRHIGRIMLPHASAKITPSHQDFLHIQGASSTWTCWTPLGDVPLALGGLAILKGSHQAGLLGVTAAPGAGGLESILCGLDYEWLTIDYESGDIVTFHSHTVHKSLPNRRPGQIRLSCDYRYQPVNEVIEGASLLPHGPFTWEELYKGWQSEDLKYYWSKQALSLSTFDESIRWQKDKIC